MKYAVMLEARDGTMRLMGDYWEFCYHLFTWTIEESYQAAQDTIRGLREGDPAHRTIRRLYIEERPY